MTLGERIYKLRTEKNLSQGELADELGVSRQSISKWETNASVPELDKLVKLGEVFAVSLDTLILDKKPLETESEPKLVCIEKKQDMSVKKTIGVLLLSAAALVWVLVSMLGGIAEGLIIAIPFVACGLICFFVHKYTGLWCAWVIYLLTDLYLRFSTGVNWSYIVVPQVYQAEHLHYLLAAWALLLAFLLLTVITIVGFRKMESNVKCTLTVASVAWTAYILAYFITIPPYEGNLYDINGRIIHQFIASVTSLVRLIILAVAIVFSSVLILKLLRKRKARD